MINICAHDKGSIIKEGLDYKLAHLCDINDGPIHGAFGGMRVEYYVEEWMGNTRGA